MPAEADAIGDTPIVTDRLDAAGVAHKAEVVDALIHQHAAASAGDALEALRRVGGFEIAARKTYGKVSEGMMCSAAELGLDLPRYLRTLMERVEDGGGDLGRLVEEGGHDVDDVVPSSQHPGLGCVGSAQGVIRKQGGVAG